jgi:hypothetical protein
MRRLGEGRGVFRPLDVADPLTRPPRFDEIGEEYVRQIVDLSPGQRKRYLGQLQVLSGTPVGFGFIRLQQLVTEHLLGAR